MSAHAPTSAQHAPQSTPAPRDTDHRWEHQGQASGADGVARKSYGCRYCGCAKLHGDPRRIGGPAAGELPIYISRGSRLEQGSPPACLSGAVRLQLELGEERMQAALDCIQEAQNILGRALENISPIIGGSPLHAKGRTLYDRIKTFWYETEKTRDQLRRKQGPKVDEINLSAEQNRRACSEGSS